MRPQRMYKWENVPKLGGRRRRAAEEFRRCITDQSEQRHVTCRYFRNGSLADISHPELIDFLGVSTPSVLERAGYSDEQAQRVMDMLATLTDEELSATQP